MQKDKLNIANHADGETYWIHKTFTMRHNELDDSSCLVSIGEGSKAQQLELANEVAASLLSSPGALTEKEWVAYLQKTLHVNEEKATGLKNQLKNSGILSNQEGTLTPSEHQWLELNWSDALHEYWLEHDMVWKHDYRNNPKVMTILDGENIIPETPPPGPSFAVPLKDESVVMLPQDIKLAASFSETVQKRRTAYNFSDSTINLQDLATILKWTMKGQWTDGVAPLRITQSYSRGEPFVAFVLAGKNSPEWLNPGVCYQYDPVAESLVPVSKFLEPKLSDLLWGQNYGDEAPISIVLAAQWMHFMWKYRSPRAYRWVFTECGSFMQTLLTTATALGYRTWQTPALDDKKFAAVINSHPKDLEALYLVAIGEK